MPGKGDALVSKKIKSYLDFRGGLNVDAAPDNLADNELMLAENADLDERGAISKRRGTAPLNAASYGEQVEQLIEWSRRDGTKILLAVVGTTLCKINADYTKTNLQNLAGAGIGYFSYADNFFFCDGANYWYYDGTNVRTVETDGPATAPTLAGSGSGSGLAAGEYKGKVVFVNDAGALSAPSPEKAVTITAGQQIDWSAIATGPAGTTKRRLYRTAVGGSIFKFLHEIPDNTTTTYTDKTADANLGAALPADNDLAPIKRCKHFLWHPKSQRIFAVGDTDDRAALYYSEPGEPGYWRETSKLYPTTGDGPAYGLALFGEAMMVIYQNSNWAWKGVSPATDAEWIKLPSDQGTVAGRTIRLTPNSLTFLSQGGIISLSPGLIDYSIVMLTGSEMIKNRAKDKVTSIIRSITNQGIACAVYDRINERYLLAYTDTPGATRNNKVLVMDWGLQSFTTYTGLQVNDLIQRANGDILIATDGYILKAGQGYKDWDLSTGDYKPIAFRVKTKQWDLDYPIYQKKTRKIFLAAKQYGVEASAVDIKVSAGYPSIEFIDVSLDESFVWGEVWGTVWGWTDYTMLEGKCKLKGHRFQVDILNNEIDQPVTLYGIAFEYRVKKAKGVKIQ